MEDVVNILYEDVIKLLNIENFSEAEKTNVTQKFAKVLADKMFLKIVEQIPEKDKTELARLFIDPEVSDEFRLAFLQNHIPNFFDFLEQEINSFKKELKPIV